MNKNIICYFSATGTTRDVALKIKNMIDSDIFEIEPVNKYTSEDLDWTNKQSRSTIEMNDENTTVEIKNKIDLSKYENVIIGFPVWWYREPSIIDTFILENDLSNKNVYVFVTSGSSSVDSTIKHLKDKFTNINFVGAVRLTNNVDNESLKEWLGNNE